MGGFREPEIPREQIVLWPQRLDEAVRRGDPVRQVQRILWSPAFAEVFAAFERGYVQVEGRPAYHPRYLAALYIFGCMVRVRSSRGLEEACRKRLDVLWLMEGQQPDHSTIAEFVQRHKQDLRALFKEVLKVAVAAGLVTLKLAAGDGTKLWANASRESVHSEEWLRKREGELDELVRKAEAEFEANEQRPAGLLDESAEAGTPDEKLRQLKAQQERVAQALAVLERRAAEHQGHQAQVKMNSVTDPESRHTKDKAGRTRPCYNALVAVDGEAGLVTAVAVQDTAGDEGQLMPLVQQSAENTGLKVQAVAADSQFNTGPDLRAAEAAGVATYLPDNGSRQPGVKEEVQGAEARLRQGEELKAEELQKLQKAGGGQLPKQMFHYAPEADVYVCPRGERLGLVGKEQAQRSWGKVATRRYGGAQCGGCPWRQYCCGAQGQPRVIMRDEYEADRERLRARMGTEEGRAQYKRRAELAERPFAYVKGQWGVRQFLRRGLEMVRAEWTLLLTAYNLFVLLTHWDKLAPVLEAAPARGP